MRGLIYLIPLVMAGCSGGPNHRLNAINTCEDALKNTLRFSNSFKGGRAKFTKDKDRGYVRRPYTAKNSLGMDIPKRYDCIVSFPNNYILYLADIGISGKNIIIMENYTSPN